MPELCRDSSCVECGGKGRIASGREVCPQRQDRAAWVFWLCGCGAYVGCHPGTAVPMGRPGNGRTRSYRIQAHQALDRRWMRVGRQRSKHATSRSRPKAYAWLAAMAMNWARAKARKPSETAFPTDSKPIPGAWTHVPRAPVRVMTDDEKRAFLASRPDLAAR